MWFIVTNSAEGQEDLGKEKLPTPPGRELRALWPVWKLDLKEVLPFNEYHIVNVVNAAATAKSLQSCLTLSDPMDCSLPGSSVHGIFQARVLEWVAISFSECSEWSFLISESGLGFVIKRSRYCPFLKGMKITKKWKKAKCSSKIK